MANTKSKLTTFFSITPPLIIVAELFKMTKFKNVESKVSMGRPSTAGTRRPASASKLMGHSDLGEEKKVIP